MRGRLDAFDDHRIDRRLRWTLAIYLAVVAVIVAYNARSVAHQSRAALIVNVAARQRALAERYVKDVILERQGAVANPSDDASQLLSNDNALLSGGDVLPVQGADGSVPIPPASGDPIVVAKLTEEHRLIEKLISAGDGLMALAPGDPTSALMEQQLRVVGGQVTTISNDAVGQMTKDSGAAIDHLVVAGIVLGFLGALVAVAMGLLLKRNETKRSARFRSLVHNASDLITVVDATGTIRYKSPSVERFLGVSSDKLMDTDYLGLVDPSDRERLRVIFADLARSDEGVATAEYRVQHADGSSRFVESIISSLLNDPTVRGLILNTRDVTDRKTLEDELAHQAFHDSLTGLSNRAVFRDRVEHGLARAARRGDSMTVLLLDLDDFKTINDSLGHDAGDELLVAVAGRLLGANRSSDTVARLGGDEFAILLEEGGDEERSAVVAERLIECLGPPFEVRGREVFVRASIGIAIADALDSTDDLIRNADTAMYAAKSAGKGRYEFFRPDMHARALAHFEVLADLERALTREEFEVHYQPIVDLASGSVSGMEALVRWQHPTRGLLPPFEFIGVAETTGMIVPLGNWVLTEACRQTAAWRTQWPSASDLWVSVNLSTRQLVEADLVDQVRDVLAETGLDPSALVLELTEGSLMQDMNKTVSKLRGLKALGVKLAIDDFGTGSSSLGNLRQFPVDLLKIDKSFVDDIAEVGSECPALVHAIVDLAKTLNLQTVAEGIEQSDQLSQIISLGCHSGQGYLFARPLASPAMADLLRDGDPGLAGTLSDVRRSA
jgi:diguanylate cyclase (GGDEF)-like protein/PAS domain S-box-containing protein